jgi:hypothetical protein
MVGWDVDMDGWVLSEGPHEKVEDAMSERR